MLRDLQNVADQMRIANPNYGSFLNLPGKTPVEGVLVVYGGGEAARAEYVHGPSRFISFTQFFIP